MSATVTSAEGVTLAFLSLSGGAYLDFRGGFEGRVLCSPFHVYLGAHGGHCMLEMDRGRCVLGCEGNEIRVTISSEDCPDSMLRFEAALFRSALAEGFGVETSTRRPIFGRRIFVR